MLYLYTFGGLRIERDGTALQLPTQKARTLLAYLLTFRDRFHPRPVLAGTLWPELPEEKARRRLSDTLWRIRHLLGDYVTADEERLWFNVDLPHWLDVAKFESKIKQARDEDQPRVSRVSLLVSCVELYRGPFFDGLYDDWLLLERERLRGLFLEVLRRLLEMRKQAGDYVGALRVAQRMVTVEPLHEAAHRELMRLYHLLGRGAEAIDQYHRCRKILLDNLETAPAPETEALYRVLRRRVPDRATTRSAHLPSPARRLVFDLNEPPLVGRDAERAALLGHLEAAASGRGGMVLLEGETGIGKTRLARELVAGARWRNICASMAGAEASGASSSYGLMLAALTPTLSTLRVRQLSRLIDPVHLQTVAPIIPSVVEDLPPLPDLPPPQARERLQQAVIALIRGLARIAPHLWVLEDVQWADGETLSLLPLLLPQLEDSRALFLLTGRSAEMRSHPATWTALQTLDRAGSFPRYVLGRLPAETVGALVRRLLGADDPSHSTELAQSLAGYLMRASEGVPLYIVETLKAWRDEGHLLDREGTGDVTALGGSGGWRWRGDVPVIRPSHLGATVISRRLSRLSPRAGDVLDAAAVIGAEVDLDLLTHVCAPPGSASDLTPTAPCLLTGSDELQRLGFLVETEVGYRFAHEQVRQAVYRRLAPSRRQHLHRRVALAAERLCPDQFDLLAHHFTAAGMKQPAIQYLARAADRDRELFAHPSALACYGRLLDLLTHPDDRSARYDALRDRAEVLGWIGDREAQGRDLDEMLHLARALTDDVRLARALHLRSEWHRLQGSYPSAEKDALAALEIYRRLGDDCAQATLLTQFGWNIVYTIDSDQASDYFQQALAIYRTLGDLEGQINCLSGLTAAAELGGDFSLALSYLQENLILAETTGDPRRIGRAVHNTGVVYYDLGDMDAAETHLRQALRLKETIGDRRSAAITRFYLGVVATERGDSKLAQAYLDTALETFRKVQDASWEGDALAALGRLALQDDNVVIAADYLDMAYRRRRELGEPAYAVIDLSYLALAVLASGDVGAAWRHSQEAVAELDVGLSGVEHPQRIYFNHYRVAEAARYWAAARKALAAAAQVVNECAERIADPMLRETYRAGHRANRAIATALAAQPPWGCLRVHLPRADAPAHRRPTPEEVLAVTWTVDAGEADSALARRRGKVALRHDRILRLLAEAETVGALPTVADLAGALDVSPRTIRADLAALRRQGHAVRTRGHAR